MLPHKRLEVPRLQSVSHGILERRRDDEGHTATSSGARGRESGREIEVRRGDLEVTGR